MVMGWLASSAGARRLALHVLFVYIAANGWRAPSGSWQLAGGRCYGSSAAGTQQA